MTVDEWHELEKESKRYDEAYCGFMYEKGNAFRCSECPENRDMKSVDSVGPCGQQNCWVVCHCGSEANG